jgi:aryl-alcohol dehydrogenase-like predicted oxidoreductase
MEYRLLGRSGLKVSALSIGTATFGGDGAWGSADLQQAKRQIDLCLDHGVNFIDTANVYAAGRSETIIGEALSDGRRDRLVVATKARFPVGGGPNDQGLSRAHIVRECESSLRRLKSDHIDLYQVHGWDGQTPLEETIEALDTLIRQGKVRYVGCSNYSAWHLMKALHVADTAGHQRFVSQQVYYSLLDRDVEHELVPAGHDQGVSLIVWSPLAGGWLSGKYTRQNQPVDGRQQRGVREPPITDWARLWSIVDVLSDVARGQGITEAQVALAWLMRRPMIASVLLGGRTVEQFAANLKAAEVVLSGEDIARLNTASERPLPYPYWHQAYHTGERLSAADKLSLQPYLGRDQTAARS